MVKSIFVYTQTKNSHTIHPIYLDWRRRIAWSLSLFFMTMIIPMKKHLYVNFYMCLWWIEEEEPSKRSVMWAWTRVPYADERMWGGGRWWFWWRDYTEYLQLRISRRRQDPTCRYNSLYGKYVWLQWDCCVALRQPVVRLIKAARSWAYRVT